MTLEFSASKDGKKLELSDTIVIQDQCETCKARFQYNKKIEVSKSCTLNDEVARETVGAELLREMEEKLKDPGHSIVPCPACRRLNKAMRLDHIMMVFFMVIGMGLCLAGVVFIGYVALEGHMLFWMLLILAALGFLGCFFAILAWPFGVFKEKIGVLLD